MRATPTVLILGLLSQACVIYEEHYDGDTACPPDATWPDSPRPGGDGTDTDVQPDPAPIVLDLHLTDADGYPGEVLLSTLVSNEASFDLGRVQEVHFARDITVADAIVREDEIVLLLAIDADATPGLVDAFVTLDDGTPGLLAEPFRVLEPVDDGTTGTDDGTTGTDDGTTGTDDGTTGTDDTGTDDGGGVPGSCAPMTDTSDTGC